MSANDINSPERVLFGPRVPFGLGNSLSGGGPQTIVLAFVRHLAKSVARPHPKPQNGSFLGPQAMLVKGLQPSFCTKIGLFVVSDSPMRFRQPKNGLFYGLGALRLKGLRAVIRVLGTENGGFCWAELGCASQTMVFGRAEEV